MLSTRNKIISYRASSKESDKSFASSRWPKETKEVSSLSYRASSKESDKSFASSRWPKETKEVSSLIKAEQINSFKI